MTVDEKINVLRQQIAESLCEIEDLVKRWKLDLPNITFVARHPDSDENIIVVTNETVEGLKDAAIATLMHQVRAAKAAMSAGKDVL